MHFYVFLYLKLFLGMQEGNVIGTSMNLKFHNKEKQHLQKRYSPTNGHTEIYSSVIMQFFFYEKRISP